MYCNVLVTRPFNDAFTYKIGAKQKVQIGSVVSVSFGKKDDQLGIVIEKITNLSGKQKLIKIKEIDKVFENLIISNSIIQYINWISNYTLAPKGLVLKLFLVNNKIINHTISEDINFTLKTKQVLLNTEQKKSYNIIKKNLFNFSQPIVLEGVTGSGKTEVYFEAIEKVFKKNKQILIMLPEISLTPQLELRFKERFGFLPLIWHSKISQKNRHNIWHLCYKGKPLIIIGARSSLFLPFNKLGLIIVDEEHDLSYKQEDNIRYQARDLAVVRSKIEKIPIILSSATPSIETQNNINKKNYLNVFLPNQFSGLELPIISLIDLKKEKLLKNSWISKSVLNEINNCIENGKQALLFLNKRGYSPLSLCSNCGYRFQCDYCSSWLVVHREKNRLLCHHCGKIYSISKNCSKCKSKDTIRFVGPGIERLEEELRTLCPNYNIAIMSSDNANTPNKIKKIISDYSSKKIDILIATQIMAKGYHFPNLSLVCVIDADAGLMGGDIKAIERTYNLLEQVGGRAGRTNETGKVLIQTFYPQEPLMIALKNRNRKNFIQQCLEERKKFNNPPFSFLTSIIISGPSKANAESYALKLAKSKFSNEDVSIFGPVEAPLFLLRGQYRFRILLKGKSRKILNKYTQNIVKSIPLPSNLRLIIDVDPYSFS